MHVFLIAALSADGFIARDAHHLASWTSKEDKRFFVEKTASAGVVVMGSHTYETIGKPLKGRLNIVYSRSRSYEGVEVTQQEPAALLKDLEQRGYHEVAIIGGAHVYTLFMSAGLINTLYLTVEPLTFGQGLPLFNKPVEANLRLKDTTRLGENSIALEYEVLAP